MVMAAAASGRSFLHCVGDNEKRWLVFGIGLNKVLVSQIRSFVEREIQKEYCNIKSSHGIDTQATPTRLTHWPNLPAKKVFLKYENINGNDARPKVHGKFNYSAFDCRVLSHIDFAKLYVENFMAKFNAFDEHCDASAVLILLSKVPVFSATVQSAASDLRQSRNSWAHCAFKDWDTVKFRQSFDEMEKLVKALGLPVGDQAKLLSDLQDWESKGTLLCMNATVDPDLLQLVQHHVNELKSDVDKMSFDMESERKSVEKALKNFDELDARVSGLEQGFGHLQHEQKSLKSDVEDVKLFVEREKVQRNWDPVQPEASCANVVSAAGRSSTHSHYEHEIADCESDIRFFAERHDPDTRNWLFDDFNKWFSDPGDSRAYVLLGDAGVGKSVIAGALAQRMKKHLGAAYFCRHYDDTRNDPRYLLGTLASQLCKCNSHYNNIVGGIDGVITMLHNNKLGVQELFTKLLEEPLAKCSHLKERKLVIIDALDETEYESREDFLFLIKERFPRLPHWLLFFITSRPEDKIRERLERYNPCVRICAGDSEQHGIYQQHEGDLRRFFENGVDLSLLQFTVEEMTKSCNGLFLHAFYLRKKLNDLAKKGKMDYTLSDLLVDDVEDFFRDNFQRVFSRVGKDLYEKLIGCILAAPSPLPVSFIPLVLLQEKSSLDEQEVIDAVMQFAWNQTSNDTVTFLHKLIPTWLTKIPTDREDQRNTKRKDCPHLLIDKRKAEKYLARFLAKMLSAIVDRPPSALSFIKVDVQKYVFRFAIRFLCQYGDQESVGIVFRCLKSFHFLEKRIESGKIGIYHLVEDLKFASCCRTFEDLHEKNILHEISNALESNVHILLECPQLLISCLRSGSKVLQETGLIPKLSGPWLEWSAFDGESITCLSGFNVFATASDQRTVAASNGRSIVFVDASRLTIVSGPFEVSQSTIKEIKNLEFSPDGKWVFFGRLDKWFSVERKRAEDFPQFSGNEVMYEWSTLTPDDQYIVVKRIATCPERSIHCVSELFALWALQEIHHDVTLPCNDHDFRGIAERFQFSNHCGNVPRRLAELEWHDYVSETLAKRLLDYLKAPELYQPSKPFKRLASCHHGAPSCEKLGELLRSIDDSSLRAVRLLIVELYPHIFDFQVWNVRTGKSLLYDVFFLRVQLNEFTYFWHVAHDITVTGFYGIIAKASSIINIAVANAVHAAALDIVSFKPFIQRGISLQEIVENLEEREDIERQVAWLARIFLASSRKRSQLFLRKLFCVSFICVSPRKKWLLLVFLNKRNILRVYSLSEGNEEQHFLDINCIPRDLGEPFVDFTFTNDDSYFIYSTLSGSLHALCLQTDTILKIVSGTALFYCIDEKQFCYFFQGIRGERKKIFLTDFFSPLRFVASTFVRKVHPSEPLSLCSPRLDSLISLSFTYETVSFVLRCLLDDYRKQKLDNFVLSPDGKLIAIHRGNKIELLCSLLFLYDSKRFTVYEHESSFTTALAFSVDSKWLLFCVQDGVNDPHIHEWDVEKGVLVSFKFPVLCPPTVACCCLSSDKAMLILCGDNEVEIWEYENSPCRLLARSGVSSFYSTYKFSHCTLSVDNNLLACCIGNNVVLFSSVRDSAKTSPPKAILRGHLARTVFSKFLKVNRYLLTYDIDGLVFLWELSRTKAVAFARITQGQESIVCLLMSPKEDTAVCLLSSSRVCVIKLWKMEDEPLWMQPMEDTVSSSEIRRQTVRELVSKSEISPETSRDENFSLSQWKEDMFYVYEDEDDNDDDDEGDDDDDNDDEVDKYD
ncbi:uncharacterized protein [Montipora foliosa]|uniref:uncharacterized protein n=1 Tax=Montipora foliosa TaxID=591990 RepID=UPI0035F1DE7C